MVPRRAARAFVAGCLAMLTLAASAAARLQDDPVALAAALLAVPSASRAALLETRHIPVTHALVMAIGAAGNKAMGGGALDAALDAYLYAQSLAASIDDSAAVADILLGVGQIHARRAEYDKAIAALTESLDIATRRGKDLEISSAANNLGIVYKLLGDYREARAMYSRALAVAEAAHDDERIGRALNNLGNVEGFQGDFDAAVVHLGRALEIAERRKVPQSIASASMNLGNIHYVQGNVALALQLDERALTLFESTGNPALLIGPLMNIGLCERDLGHPDRAMPRMLRAAAIAEEIKLPAEAARARYNIASLYGRQQRWEDALAELRKSFAVRDTIGDRQGLAETLVKEAEALRALGRPAEALDRAARAVAAGSDLDLPEVSIQGGTVAGQILAGMGRADEAEAALRAAIQVAESVRSRVAGTGADRAKYFEGSIRPYHALVSLLAAERPFDALLVADQAHARALGDALSGGVAEEVLTGEERDRQRVLQHRLAALNRQIDAAPAGTDLPRLKELASARRAVRLEQDQQNAELYGAHPDLRLREGAPAALQMSTLTARLDGATAIVEFVQDPSATVVLIATAGPRGVAIRTHTIPIAAAVLDARVSAFNAAVARRDLGVAAEARALGALLLDDAMTPAVRRLVIVPDGSLWTLPFHALRTRSGRFVVEDHVVSYAPSIVALQLLADRKRPASARGRFLGVADTDAARPLPETRRQVEALAADRSWRGVALTGVEATEPAVRKAMPTAGVIHIGSHGVFEDASPLYSHVVLAPSAGIDTSSDGRLDAWELMHLPLQASLVVLAGCETGRGGISRGEGVMGLSWAALAAGAPAAVVSLWRVDETATSSWMAAFYKEWNQKAGVPGAAASAAAAAARQLIASGRYRHPFYWAAFTVIGDPAGPLSGPLARPRRAGAVNRPKDSPRLHD